MCIVGAKKSMLFMVFGTLTSNAPTTYCNGLLHFLVGVFGKKPEKLLLNNSFYYFCKKFEYELRFDGF